MNGAFGAPRFSELVSGKPYVGRGIICGLSPDASKAVTAYFITGRSANSRNRIFLKDGDGLMIKAFDESKTEDPSLIIYHPLRSLPGGLVVTNGDQTDTICDFLAVGKSFEEALRTRTFEPDAPNYTPRISAVMSFGGRCRYAMSILKSGDPEGLSCRRFFFEYEALPARGHFLHTYMTDGDPLPAFRGEPEELSLPDSADGLAEEIWRGLNEENRIALYVRYTDLQSGEHEDVLFNEREKGK